MNKVDFYEQMLQAIILNHFNQTPVFVKHIKIGICNEVYDVKLKDKNVIVRLSLYDKFLMGSSEHIPQFKSLGIQVPDILFEDFSKSIIPISYQIQSKIEGQDLGQIVETLTDSQLEDLAKEIAGIFNKTQTIAPIENKYGVIWGGGDNEISDSWTERMRIWIDESMERGKITGVMDESMSQLAEKLYTKYKSYFDSVKPVTYYGDICSKNVMIHDGKFSGLVDLDGITQGDPLEAVGRIKISWYGTQFGEVYLNAIMQELNLNQEQKSIVTVYALLNQISWTCENGIQFNQNTQAVVNKIKEQKDKEIIQKLAEELSLFLI